MLNYNIIKIHFKGYNYEMLDKIFYGKRLLIT